MLFAVLRGARRLIQLRSFLQPAIIRRSAKVFPLNTNTYSTLTLNLTPKLLENPAITQISNNITSRSLTKFSLGKGKRKSVKVVLKRFYRLNWGGWIRTKCGRHKKLWKKTSQRKRRLRQHVFCNGTQNYLLDKMVGKYWRKPKYFVEDIYEPYHVREEFRWSYNKPRPYIPSE